MAVGFEYHGRGFEGYLENDRLTYPVIGDSTPGALIVLEIKPFPSVGGASLPTLVRSAPPFVSPLTVGRLPLSLRMLANAETVRRNWIRYLARKIAKTWFRWCHGALGFPVRGEILFALPDGERRLRFNGRNTQFGCLYLPQLAGGYEPSSLGLLDVLVGNEGCFFDVGGNFGYFSLSLAARADFAGLIHVFEPFGPSFTDLSDLVEDSGLGNRQGKGTAKVLKSSDLAGARPDDGS